MKQTNESADDHHLETRRLTRKLDLRILPLLAVIYFFSYLDRTNIANAKLAGLEHDVHLTPEQYQWCLSIFFIGYVVFEIPSNIILRRWRPSKWLSLIVFLWGLVAVSMAASFNYATLFVGRFLLGAFESGLFPGIIYYTSLWYSRQQQAIRLGFFFSFSAMAGAFGGLLAYGISQIHSTHVSGWQLIFIVEGVPTLVLAIVCWFFLPDSAEQARFLTDDERKLQIDRLARDAGASQSHSFSWAQVASVFTDWKIYAYSIIYISGTITLQGITLLMPTLILEMGHWTPVQSQLMTVPSYLAAFVAIFAVSRSSDHFTERSYHLVFTNLSSMSGLLILMFVDRHHVYILYAGVVLVAAGSYANVSIKVAWFNNNFASLTRRAVGSAVIVSIGSLGGAVSGQIYRSNQKPSYFLGNTIAFAFIALQTVLVLILRLVFARINRQRASMDKAQIDRQIARYGGSELVGDRHPEFRYTL